MNSNDIRKAAHKSVKWSFFGEVFAKIATPLSTMVLARLLAPEVFGIATAVTLVVTFCEAVTESGFAKYIIQKDFASKDDYNKHFTISFYTSLMLSILLCVLIFFLRHPLSNLVGNAGYEMVLVASCAQIPFTAVNALFSADLRRSFDFKKLFFIRIVFCATPFAVTIPLALLGMGYWSLVIGSIAAQVLECPFLVFVCKGKLKWFFSWKMFVETFRKSFPMILESTIIWFCTWTGTVVAANFFSSSVVGIVKVSNSTVNNIFALFATAFTSVLFPALSRLKNDKEAYQETFYSIQGAALSVLIPLGIGMYFYAQLVTDIFLGELWADAIFVIGIYSLTRPLMICFNNFMSEVFRSKGHFYSSIAYQLSMLGFDLLMKFTVGRISYEMFIWTTTFTHIFTTMLAIFILKFRYGFSILKQGESFFPSVACSLIMMPVVFLGSNSKAGMIPSAAQAITSASIYFLSLGILFPKVFKNSLSYVIRKRK